MVEKKQGDLDPNIDPKGPRKRTKPVAAPTAIPSAAALVPPIAAGSSAAAYVPASADAVHNPAAGVAVPRVETFQATTPGMAPTSSTATPDPCSAAQVHDGRGRAVVDAVLPEVDGGRFPVKRIAGEPFRIEAHCFTDGHDRLRTVLRWQSVNDTEAYEVEMAAQVNDVWVAEFTPPVPDRYRYTVLAWVDHFESWRRELERREDIADIRIALQVGSGLIDQAARRAAPNDAATLENWATLLRDAASGEAVHLDAEALKAMALDPARAAIVARYADRSLAASATRELVADRKRAGYGSWYEMFPRSAATETNRQGTFRDVEARLPYVAKMGFDVLYFPPIHPIGRVNRKGRNNSLKAEPEDVGSPWAIGSAEGGHKDILPALGSLADFNSLAAKAREFGMEIALDIAYQCAPDHPYVSAHPEWFKRRPDGSVQYAENPPKKYQDIYPFDFETEDWRALWDELKSVMDFWIAQDVKIFRVDNPHTKSFGFWEWVINEIKRVHPDVIFLAEAFTRPKVMHRLAKLGFSQSYTYFTWRNTKQELVEYFTELTQGPGQEYFRPNVWPNTPDILHETLQSGLRPEFAARLVLAATLAANYGIYGPAFELMESKPRDPGSEEYRDSEKYQLRHWEIERADSLWPLIARLNRIRRDNPALQSDRTLRFCAVDNEQLIAYVKRDAAFANIVLTVVNLDPYHVQSGWLDLDMSALELAPDQPYQVHDLLSDQRYQWHGRYNFVMLDPQRMPAHVFRVRRRMRSEQDFDYFT
jgi:starch synthase (maltosyl-transferring)